MTPEDTIREACEYAERDPGNGKYSAALDTLIAERDEARGANGEWLMRVASLEARLNEAREALVEYVGEAIRTDAFKRIPAAVHDRALASISDTEGGDK